MREILEMLVVEFNLVLSFIKYHVKSSFRDEKLQCPLSHMNFFKVKNVIITPHVLVNLFQTVSS